MPKSFERLPKSVIPSHYIVDLTPNLKTFKCQGYCKISLDVHSQVSEIRTNAVDIIVSSAKYNNTEAQSISYDKDNEAVIFKFENELTVGQGELELVFESEINDKLKGMYQSKYITPEKEERICAVTQFESTDARRCFPCWDEPAVKSTFTCSMTIDENLLGLSNMPVTEETKPAEGLKKLQFDKSPIMSTYLLAFFIGEADYVEAKTKYGVTVRVYTPKGKKHHGEFALDMGVKSLEFYEDYFNVKFPLPKLDQIGLDDFSAGAMENWGLVTYRSNILLVDPENSSTSTKETVAIVVAHELAHQWFGNLVTMEWWTHLWLNEGFASFMEYLCTDAVHPEYNIFDTFVLNDFNRGMELDALDSSHPIEVPVNHPSEVDEIFDHISYCKGCSTIRMLHDWIGDGNFRSGMADYLNKHAYKNALTEQLWDALENAAKMPVAEVMSTWTSQVGFPLLKIESVEGSATKLKITQSKFSANGPNHVANDQTTWKIPIQICNSNSPTESVATFLMKEKTMEIEIPEASWTKINFGSTGFYRVQYDPALSARIEVEKLVTRDRLQLQSDAFALCKAGYIPITDYFDLLKKYENESEYTVMGDILAKLGDVSLLCRNLDQSTADNFKKWKVDFLQKLKISLGWQKKDSDTHTDLLLRGRVMGALGTGGDADVAAEANAMFENHLSANGDKEKEIPGDLRSAVFQTIASNATDKDPEPIKKLIKFFHDNKDSQEQQALVERNIGYVNTEENVKLVMNFIKNEMKPCNVPFAYVGLCYGSKLGAEATWDFIKNNMEWILKNCQGFLVQAMFGRTLCVFGSKEKYNEIKEFFEAQKMEVANRAISQMMEKVDIRAKMLERDGENVCGVF